jgi:hypothetical protein
MVKRGLAWRLPGSLVLDLVAYVVARLNVHCTSALTEVVAPKVAFTGMLVHYHKDVKLAFGDYVEASEGNTNTSCPRSSACIVLCPANNVAGSWPLFKIDTHTKVCRSNMVKLVAGELIIQAMNNIADEDEQSALEPVRQRVEKIAETQQSASVQDKAAQEGTEEPMNDPEGILEGIIEEKELVAADDEGEVSEESAAIRNRSRRSVNRPSRFLAITKISKLDWKVQEAAKVIRAEIRMLFEELKAFWVVKRASIKAGTKILKSHMFVVAKYLASGEFDKMKARLVADDRDQDAEFYPDKSSPTVAIHSVFSLLGVMAGKPWRTTVKIDIKGAFVQTPM